MAQIVWDNGKKRWVLLDWQSEVLKGWKIRGGNPIDELPLRKYSAEAHAAVDKVRKGHCRRVLKPIVMSP